MSSDLANWVERAREGQQSAFRRLYDDHVDRVWRLACRVLRCPDLAQDCVQESFVSAFNGLDSLSEDVTFGGWLYRITFRKAIDIQRRERRHEGDPVDPPGVEDLDEDVNLRRQLTAAIEGLDSIYRDVFLLYDLVGHTHPEIGGLLDIPVGTSKRRLSIARQQLREQLKSVMEQ